MIEMFWMMSLQSCILILIVLLMRFLLRKYPKIYSYSLWALVLIRLLCPVFIESAHSLQPELVSSQIEKNRSSFGKVTEEPDTSKRSEWSEKDGYAHAENNEAGGMMKGNVLLTLKLVYMAGAVLTAGRYALQYVMLKRRIKTAVWEYGNVWLSEGIASPFVMGIFCPRIYLPYGIPTEEKQYILKHEMTHIRHKDPVIRYLGMAASCLHWWNPLVWYAVYKMNQDMEMFCDEAALAKAALNEKKSYANTLLQFAIQQSKVTAALPFGASNTEKRICNVLQKKKRSLAVIGMVILTAVFCMGAFMTVPQINNVVQGNGLGQLTEPFLSQLPGEAFREQLSKEVFPMGDWQITSLAGTARVYGASGSEIEKMIGTRLKYGKDFYKNETSFVTHDKIFYSREEQTPEEFEALWKVPWTDLGVNADKVYCFEVEGKKEKSLGDFFYMTDAETVLIVYEGVFFKAERVV